MRGHAPLPPRNGATRHVANHRIRRVPACPQPAAPLERSSYRRRRRTAAELREEKAAQRKEQAKKVEARLVLAAQPPGVLSHARGVRAPPRLAGHSGVIAALRSPTVVVLPPHTCAGAAACGVQDAMVARWAEALKRGGGGGAERGGRPVRASVLLVDGYNVLHMEPSLTQLFYQRNTQFARAEMEKWCALFAYHLCSIMQLAPDGFALGPQANSAGRRARPAPQDRRVRACCQRAVPGGLRRHAGERQAGACPRWGAAVRPGASQAREREARRVRPRGVRRTTWSA